jgi:hypothetical protein
MPELYQAAFVGCQRQIMNLFAEREDRYGHDPEKGWQDHIEGSAGEMVVAKWRNKYWSGNIGNLKADDVGRAQVRTAAKHSHCLIVHDYDLDERPFVIVTGLAPNFVIRGWIYGGEAKQERYWSDPTRKGRHAFFVPQSALRPIKAKAE